MRRRVQKEFGTSDFWQVKHVDGGLFDLDFIVQYQVLCHGQKVAGRRRDNGTWLEALEEAGAVSREMAHSLQADLGLWRTVQALLRLTVEQRFDPEAAPAALRAMLVRATGAIDFDALTAQIADAAADVRRHYDEIIGAPAEAARRASEQQEETA